jgi:putative tricarboxylic transport membrane protein
MTAQNSRAKFALSNINIPEAGLGAFALVLGSYVAIDASGYHDGSTYDGLGPSLMPYIIAAGLILTGLPILVGALLSRRPAEPVEQIDWMPIALITLGLILPIAFILWLGWIPVITVVFALGARAFGSRRTILDLGLGLAFGIVTFVIFNYGLGLHLPVGRIFTRLFG